VQDAGPDHNTEQTPAESPEVMPEVLGSGAGVHTLPLIRETFDFPGNLHGSSPYETTYETRYKASTGQPPPSPMSPLAKLKRDWMEPLGLPALAGITLVGFLGNLGVRTGFDSVVAMLAVVAVAGLATRSGLIQGRGARLMLAGALGLALWLPLRATPWLVSLNVLTIAGLLVGAVVFARFDLWAIHPSIIGRIIRRTLRVALGPVLLATSAFGVARSEAGPSRSNAMAIARGAALALIPLVPIVALLASADAVFASFLRTPGNVGSLMAHAVLSAVMAAMVAGLFAVHLGAEIEADGSYRRPLGTTEVTVVLVALVTVFSAFAVSQVITATGGATHIIETADLTRAEYAREGFFQLLAVSVLTLGVLFVARIFANADNPQANFRLTVLATIASLLTLAIVAVSLFRLALYVDAFGFTMLRLYSMLFGVLIAAVFVLYIAHLIAPVARLWFVPAVSLAAWALLFGLNGANPEAFVMQWNIEHQATIIEFDAHHAARRPPDAIPTLIANLDQLSAEDQEVVTQALCQWRGDLDPDSQWGILGWNQSRSAAADAQASLACS